MVKIKLPVDIRVMFKGEDDFLDYVKMVSRENPGLIVTFSVTLGTARIYFRDSQPRTDSEDTRQTYQDFGGFLKAGKVIKPTKAWLARHNFIPVFR